MINFNYSPKSFFSLNDWSYGYIFQQLYLISEGEYGNSFYLNYEDEYWFISSSFKKKSEKTTKNGYSFNLNYYLVGKTGNLVRQDDPNVEIQNIAKSSLIHYLGIGDDLTEFYKFVTEFDELVDLISILPGYRLSSVLMVEWMPILAYLSTNTTVDMFHNFLMNFLHNWGINITHSNFKIPCFPPIKNLLPITEETYRLTKIGYRSKYMPEMVNCLVSEKTFSQLINNYDKGNDHKKVLKELNLMKGIGDYSARCILLYGLRDYSVGFVDSFIKILMNKYFKIDKKIGNKSLQNILDEKFYPYQGLLIDWLTAVYSITTNTNKDKYFTIK